jgi:hypothetical protein
MKTYYIGLDVHKENISIAHALAGSRKTPEYLGECGGSNLAIERALRKLAKKLEVEFKSLHVCYEAGPTGVDSLRSPFGPACGTSSPLRSGCSRPPPATTRIGLPGDVSVPESTKTQ